MWVARALGSPTTRRRRALNRVLLRLPLRQRRRAQYFIAHQRWLRLDSPRTWSEKINWRMVNDRRELLVMACDKEASKTYVADLYAPDVVRIPRTVWIGDDPDELHAVCWPEHWVLKANHGTGAVVLGHGRPEPGQRAELVDTARQWLADSGLTRWGEWAYGQARKAVLLEEALPGTTASGLPDYKFFVIGGSAMLVQVDTTRFERHRRRFYTPSWQPLTVTCEVPLGPVSPRPEHLDAMVTAAEKLGSAFDAVRVDLYDTGGAIWFGEFTVYSGSGLAVLHPTDLDDTLGAAWTLPF